MGDQQLFSATPTAHCPGCGWAVHFFPAPTRSDLLLVLDDTWFIRPSNFSNQWLFSPKKFPDESVLERNWTGVASAVVRRVEALGWAGLGLWHHSVSGSGAALETQLAALGNVAGIQHIKVDGTDLKGEVTGLARNATNGRLRVEHKKSPGAPLNGAWTRDGRAPDNYLKALAELTRRTDVLRTDGVYACVYASA